MELHCHQATFKLLQCKPIVDGKAVGQMASLEKAIGVRLPDSIREWYSLKDATAQIVPSRYSLVF